MSGAALASEVKEHMEIVGSDGGHVGTVDKVEEDRIKLTRTDDPGHNNKHHFLPVSAVAAVADGKVHLSMDTHRAKEFATMTGGSDTVHGMGSMGAAS